MTFDEELAALLERNLPFEELEPLVAELRRKHGLPFLPAIVGTVAITEPEDSFG